MYEDAADFLMQHIRSLLLLSFFRQLSSMTNNIRFKRPSLCHRGKLRQVRTYLEASALVEPTVEGGTFFRDHQGPNLLRHPRLSTLPLFSPFSALPLRNYCILPTRFFARCQLPLEPPASDHDATHA